MKKFINVEIKMDLVLAQIAFLAFLTIPLFAAEPRDADGDINPPYNFIRLSIVGGASLDETIIYFDADATDEYDEQFDAIKMLSGNPGVPNLLSKIGEGDFSINVLGEFRDDKEIPLTISINQAGEYKINVIEFSNFDPTTMVYLEDREQNVSYNLRMQDKIAFQFPNGLISNRFFLHVDLPLSHSVVNESCLKEDGKIKISNPSTNPWDIKLLSGDGLSLVQEASNVIGDHIFSGLTGGDYLMNLTKAADGFTHNIPLEVRPGIKLDAEFTFSGESLKNNKPIAFRANQQGLGLLYNWDMGDGNIMSGDSAFSYSYEFPGIYTVTLLVSNGECSEAFQEVVTVTPDIIAGMSSSIQEENTENLHLFPVPAKDFLTIKTNGELSDKAVWMEIKDLGGKTIQKELISGLISNQEPLTIPLKSLDSGHYFLLIHGDSIRAARKFSVLQ